MITYAIVEISGRQYKVEPNKNFKVDYLGEVTSLEADKVLAVKSADKLEVGQPFLKQKLNFDVVATDKGKKIMVSTFHAKANYRRRKGSRTKKTVLVLANN